MSSTEKYIWKGSDLMYIPPFWCGVSVTIIGIVIVSLIMSMFQHDDDDEQDERRRNHE